MKKTLAYIALSGVLASCSSFDSFDKIDGHARVVTFSSPAPIVTAPQPAPKPVVAQPQPEPAQMAPSPTAVQPRAASIIRNVPQQTIQQKVVQPRVITPTRPAEFVPVMPGQNRGQRRLR